MQYFLERQQATGIDRQICQDFIAWVVSLFVSVRTQILKIHEPSNQFKMIFMIYMVVSAFYTFVGVYDYPVIRRNHRLPIAAPINCAKIQYPILLIFLSVFEIAANVSVGLKCPPVIYPDKAKDKNKAHEMKKSAAWGDLEQPQPYVKIAVPSIQKSKIRFLQLESIFMQITDIIKQCKSRLWVNYLVLLVRLFMAFGLDLIQCKSWTPLPSTTKSPIFLQLLDFFHNLIVLFAEIDHRLFQASWFYVF